MRLGSRPTVATVSSTSSRTSPTVSVNNYAKMPKGSRRFQPWYHCQSTCWKCVSSSHFLCEVSKTSQRFPTKNLTNPHEKITKQVKKEKHFQFVPWKKAHFTCDPTLQFVPLFFVHLLVDPPNPPPTRTVDPAPLRRMSSNADFTFTSVPNAPGPQDDTQQNTKLKSRNHMKSPGFVEKNIESYVKSNFFWYSLIVWWNENTDVRSVKRFQVFPTPSWFLNVHCLPSWSHLVTWDGGFLSHQTHGLSTM